MRTKKQGFTIIEMMVSMALIIFIMVILVETFVAGMNSLRELKVVGDLQEQLRVAASILRKDLAADHFEGKKRLSDPNFWADGPPREGYFRVWQGVRPNGTQLVVQDIPANNNPPNFYFDEGPDGDGIHSYRATDHTLQLTVKRRGNQAGEFVSASGGGPLTGTENNPGNGGASRLQAPGTYATQWYEVAYFLRATGDMAAGSTPLYALYRRQRLVVPTTNSLNWTSKIPVAQFTNYSEYSVVGSPLQPNLVDVPPILHFNNPNNLTIPQERFGMSSIVNSNVDVGGWPVLRNPTATDNTIKRNDPSTWRLPTMADDNPALAGSDLLLTNVVSFQVQLMFPGPTATAPAAFQDLSVNNNPSLNNRLGYKAYVFDTWSSRKDEWSTGVDDNWDFSKWNPATKATPTTKYIPSQPQIKAIKITIRVWDLKSQKTRQVTVIQDM